MTVVRKRYYFWLLKAYFKRWSKTVIISAAIGVSLFFGLLTFFSIFVKPVIDKKVEKIGLYGVYTVQNLPSEIEGKVSYGLTSIGRDGSIEPGASVRWEILDGGKKYVFLIKRKQYFHNNEELTSKNFPLEFVDVKKNAKERYVIEYVLKNAYSPFLVSVSKNIISKGIIGLGKYKIEDIETNTNFIKSILLVDREDSSVRKYYSIYPTQEALLTAFMLGEVDVLKGLSVLPSENRSFLSWKHIDSQKKVNYDKLVTLFYNVKDENLSNIKVRQALGYSLPKDFVQGERATSPIPPISIYYSKTPNSGIYDIELAKTLLDDPNMKLGTLEISTTEEFEDVAKLIASAWQKINIKTKVKIVDEIPSNFQIFLYSFKVPSDPDQYTLWHSAQKNNISNYKNDRIDKLLEDGRVTLSKDERIKIYADFQKYLINDTPASFLYFPYEYTIKRK